MQRLPLDAHDNNNRNRQLGRMLMREHSIEMNPLNG
jgi:hypothetical protein